MPERWRGRGKEDRMQGAWRMKSAMRSNSERFLAPLPRVSFYNFFLVRGFVSFPGSLCSSLLKVLKISPVFSSTFSHSALKY